MTETVIKVGGIGKKYLLGGSHSLSFGDMMRSVFQLGRNRKDQEFWALKDIDFEIKAGEAVGIMGKNGAGKSTLLKILSKITHPTTGRFEMEGRVSSLLEVGTGFHPELSGKENIFLNGTILGMSRPEIKTKFEEIVEFSGVEKFIDTPVKHYSSGMFVRLAFAVAANLEPEILIIDEVLAVGDAEFQNKCLGKMSEVTRQGRTVLFVSHNMNFIKKFCSRGILLNSGQVEFDGDINEAIARYRSGGDIVTVDLNDIHDRIGSGAFRFKRLIILNEAGDAVNHLESGSAYTFCLHFAKTSEANEVSRGRNARVSLGFSNLQGPLINLTSEQVTSDAIHLNEKGVFRFHIPKFPLSIGTYYLTLFMEADNMIQDSVDCKMTIKVENANFYQNGRMELPPGWSGLTTLVDFDLQVL